MSAKRAQLSKQAVARWDAMWAAQTAKMERQRESLTRMAHMTTEAIAALTEIAEREDWADIAEVRARAKEALAVIEGLRLREEAAAKAIDGEG